MSVVINYKGEEILSVNTDTTKTLKTSGQYCEGDIEVINTQDGGGGGEYDITATDNGDGTQSLSIVDADGGDTPIINISINKEYTVTWTDDYRWKNDNTLAVASDYSASSTIDYSDADWVMIDWDNTTFVSGKYYARLRMVGNSDFSSKESYDGYISNELDRYVIFKPRSGYTYMNINKLKGENCRVYSVSFN